MKNYSFRRFSEAELCLNIIRSHGGTAFMVSTSPNEHNVFELANGQQGSIIYFMESGMMRDGDYDKRVFEN